MIRITRETSLDISLDDERPVLVIGGERLPADTPVQVDAGVLAAFAVGWVQITAGMLAEPVTPPRGGVH